VGGSLNCRCLRNHSWSVRLADGVSFLHTRGNSGIEYLSGPLEKSQPQAAAHLFRLLDLAAGRVPATRYLRPRLLCVGTRGCSRARHFKADSVSRVTKASKSDGIDVDAAGQR